MGVLHSGFVGNMRTIARAVFQTLLSDIRTSLMYQMVPTVSGKVSSEKEVDLNEPSRAAAYSAARVTNDLEFEAPREKAAIFRTALHSMF